MCSYCDKILVGFSIKHTEAACPLRKSLYCPTCAIYGHSFKGCPVKPSKAFTEPIYVEQLILPSERRAYKIKSYTLLPNKYLPDLDSTLYNPHLIELKDTDQIIRDYLKSNGIICGSKKELRHKLLEFAKANGKVVRFISVGKTTTTK